MTWILIVMWFGEISYNAGKAALAVEFNSLEACQAAAASIKKQVKYSAEVGTIVCAAKGEKK